MTNFFMIDRALNLGDGGLILDQNLNKNSIQRFIQKIEYFQIG